MVLYCESNLLKSTSKRTKFCKNSALAHTAASTTARIEAVCRVVGVATAQVVAAAAEGTAVLLAAGVEAPAVVVAAVAAAAGVDAAGLAALTGKAAAALAAGNAGMAGGAEACIASCSVHWLALSYASLKTCVLTGELLL